MIFGFTKDEGMLFVNEIFLDPISRTTLQAILALQFGDNGSAVLDHLNYDVSFQSENPAFKELRRFNDLVLGWFKGEVNKSHTTLD